MGCFRNPRLIELIFIYEEGRYIGLPEYNEYSANLCIVSYEAIDFLKVRVKIKLNNDWIHTNKGLCHWVVSNKFGRRFLNEIVFSGPFSAMLLVNR